MAYSEIKISAYKPEGFLKSYTELVRKEMLPYQYRVMKDDEGCEKSGVFSNFINAAKVLKGEKAGPFYGMVFQDSDAGKWIEAVGYSLALSSDKQLEDKTDELIDLIANAQDKDGYLDTYFTISNKEKRWTNLLEAHELYCAGHLIEGACAYYETTGKDKLLSVMVKNALHIYDKFITEKKEGYPGHPEIELALLKLYRITGEEKFLELSKHFIDVRGADREYYKKEKESRNWSVWGNNAEDNYYQQSHAPVREQTDAVGHAVRAVYLYTAMADLSAETGDNSLYDACKRLWRSIVDKKLYITGGIGSVFQGESFSADYHLPSDTAYSETCAAIGLMFFAQRMLKNEVKGEYGDVMEQAFYNTVLSGIELTGKAFYYVNPLEAVPGISGCTATHWHDKITRPGWHACACCPPNAARTISSIGKYAYGENNDTVFCHLYAAGEVNFSNGISLSCKTEYPYSADVDYKIKGNGILAVRIPHWSKNTTVYKNNSPISPEIKEGYAYIKASDNDEIRLCLDMTPRIVYPSEKLYNLSGKGAICKGPLVYCFEGVDNNGKVLNAFIDGNSSIEAEDFDIPLSTGTKRLKIKGYIRKTAEGLYSDKKPEIIPAELYAIPYFLWANRGENQMRVWMDIR